MRHIAGCYDDLKTFSDGELSHALEAHLAHCREWPDNCSWSEPSAVAIQDEINRRHSEFMTATVPIADFIWETRDA